MAKKKTNEKVKNELIALHILLDEAFRISREFPEHIEQCKELQRIVKIAAKRIILGKVSRWRENRLVQKFAMSLRLSHERNLIWLD